jgi:hypothetical protein
VRVTDTIHYILATKGIFVFNYIDDLIGLAPDTVTDNHFHSTINLLKQLGLVISDSKTVAPTYVATCLGIVFNISEGFIQIPKLKLDETLSLCKFHFHKKFITKNQLQVLIGHLIFLHKAVKPLTTFWIYLEKWARLPKEPLTRALNGTSNGLWLALMRLMAQSQFLSVRTHGWIFS